MKKLNIVLAASALALLALGCNRTADVNLNPNSGANANGDKLSAKSACQLISPGVVKQKLGIEVKSSQPQSSNLGGSTCNYIMDVPAAGGKAAYEGAAVILQLSPDGEKYYNESIFPQAEKHSGIGDKAFIDGPRPESSYTASALKGKKYVMINITSFNNNGPTKEQVRDFLTYVVDNM